MRCDARGASETCDCVSQLPRVRQQTNSPRLSHSRIRGFHKKWSDYSGFFERGSDRPWIGANDFIRETARVSPPRGRLQRAAFIYLASPSRAQVRARQFAPIREYEMSLRHFAAFNVFPIHMTISLAIHCTRARVKGSRSDSLHIVPRGR